MYMYFLSFQHVIERNLKAINKTNNQHNIKKRCLLTPYNKRKHQYTYFTLSLSRVEPTLPELDYALQSEKVIKESC